jgi:hypothetical protein
MKNALIACAAGLLITSPSFAGTDDIGPGQELAKLIFGSIDSNSGGLADMGHFTAFGNDIFVSMDGNDDGKITLEEFQEWDFGFNFIAEDEGQQRAYDTAQKILFAVWDRDNNGEINGSEYHKSMTADFRRADINDDAFLSEDEFLQGYIVNRAYRAAVTGN